jgi:hypothetical protein
MACQRTHLYCFEFGPLVFQLHLLDKSEMYPSRPSRLWDYLSVLLLLLRNILLNFDAGRAFILECGWQGSMLVSTATTME